jgi:hypothetical protein
MTFDLSVYAECVERHRIHAELMQQAEAFFADEPFTLGVIHVQPSRECYGRWDASSAACSVMQDRDTVPEAPRDAGGPVRETES